MSTALVSNVSDTARWVAAIRAAESARPDALFHDPLAGRLAGDQGRAIAARAPRSSRNGWPMLARTRLIDDLIATSLDEGCDRVINLAAGLDTRPYRMKLPATLEWIEADLPALVDEKERVLADEKPVCKLTRERVDLSDAAASGAFLDRALSGASNALVLTEGLLIYLDEQVVRTLSREFLARPSVRWWMLDLAAPAIKTMMERGMRADFENAPLKFAPANGIAYFEALGWRVREVRSIFHAAARYRRLPMVLRLFAIFPEADPRRLGSARWSGVVRYERG
jgi:methyltransferase (TIGR00027 family)